MHQGGAADLAHSSADVVLMSERLQPLLGAFRVSRAALRTITAFDNRRGEPPGPRAEVFVAKMVFEPASSSRR